MAQPQRIAITICGDGGCGKSSITLRLVRSQWTSDYDPTIEDSYSVTRTIDGTPALLSLTDTAGQEEYRGLISSSSLHSDAFLLVYDITNKDSLHAQLPYFIELVQQERETRAEAAQRAAVVAAAKGKGRKKADVVMGVEEKDAEDWSFVEPVVIVAGNKCDLKDERKITAREGLEWARSRGCGFMETSARECVNVEETFATIVRRVREAREAYKAAQMGVGEAAAAAAKGGSAKTSLASPKKGKTPTHLLLAPNVGPDGETVYARTMPLTPLGEKSQGQPGGAQSEDRAEQKGGKWWRWIKCW